MATKTKPPKPLSDKARETIEWCLPIIADHGEGRENLPELVEKLEQAGAKFTEKGGAHQVTCATLTASSNFGRGAAIRIWAQAARRALAREG